MYGQPCNILTLQPAQSLATFTGIKQRMEASTSMMPDLVVNVGDLSYADKWTAEGVEGKGSSYQPRWDQFGRMIQSTFSTSVPMISNNGNHGGN